ncbi:MAG TPA: helix-turn-helix domain-containing protein, partial [Xanthobacteraceae bacterium]|nr:helix-turn-helix domain-containing protein [Xanthobacteraceae bacterium]
MTKNFNAASSGVSRRRYAPRRVGVDMNLIERKAALFRLYPTPQQASQMAQIAGACRFVYNLALEQRRDWYRAG